MQGCLRTAFIHQKLPEVIYHPWYQSYAGFILYIQRKITFLLFLFYTTSSYQPCITVIIVYYLRAARVPKECACKHICCPVAVFNNPAKANQACHAVCYYRHRTDVLIFHSIHPCSRKCQSSMARWKGTVATIWYFIKGPMKAGLVHG